MPEPKQTEEWEKRFDYMERNHVYIPEHKERLKQFIRDELTQQKKMILEELKARQKLFNFIPQDEGGYKMVKSKDLDILSLPSLTIKEDE